MQGRRGANLACRRRVLGSRPCTEEETFKVQTLVEQEVNYMLINPLLNLKAKSKSLIKFMQRNDFCKKLQKQKLLMSCMEII